MDRGHGRRSLWRLRIVIPGLLTAAFLLDAGMRLLPIDAFTYRAWEALERGHPTGAVFEPNRRYVNARSYGNLAAMANLPALRQYRPVRVSTDAWGYRNASRVHDEEISAILAGDSFVVGAEVGDEQTLPSQMSTLTGCVVYNAGGLEWHATPDRIVTLARRLHLRNRLVIRVYAEEGLYAEEAGVSLPHRPGLTARLAASTPAGLRSVIGRLRGLIADAPLRILSQHALRRLEDDRVLPNRYAARVITATLSNGDWMLFWAPSVTNFYRGGGIDLDYWVWLRDDLRKADLDLLVVLVPSKYRVYRPFLVDQRPLGTGAGESLDRLERGLRTLGVSVLNLEPIFSARAARELERGEYLYYKDDMHWNARGIEVGAEAIRAARPLAEPSCRSPAAQKR